MRRAIETAPRDGKAILLEDDASGEYAVARWSAEVNGWVGESREPIQIAATHWYAMPPPSWAHHVGVFAFSSNQTRQPEVCDPLREAVNPGPVDAIEVWPMPVEDRPVPRVPRRAAALLTVATLAVMALVAVSLGIPGGPANEVPQQVASLEQDIVPQPRTDSDGTRLATTAQTTGLATHSLENEQRPDTLADELAKAQRTIKELHLQLRERASELAIARRETEMHAAQSGKTADEKAQLKEAADSTAALARDLASQLAMARREIEALAVPARDASAEAAQSKQAAESAAAELRLSLQQQRDRAEALARDLASARREIDAHATSARDASAAATQSKQAAESTADELRLSLQQQRDRAEALARDLANARREIDAHATSARDASAEAAQIRQTAASTAEELRLSLRQQRDRAEALALDLARARREIDAHATSARLASAEAAQGKQTAERTAEELRRSLQQERDRAAALANDLATARREIDAHAKLSSKTAAEMKQTRRHLQRKRDRVFELDTAQLFSVLRSAPETFIWPRPLSGKILQDGRLGLTRRSAK